MTPEGKLRTTMDVHVRSVIPNATEMFHIEIESTETSNSLSLDLKLVSYDRMPKYGHYHKCSDAGVATKLCICHESGASSFGSDVNSAGQPEMKLTLSDLEEFAGSLGNGSTVRSLDNTECVYLVTRSHSNRSSTFEYANICLDDDYDVVSFIENIQHFKLSRDFPIEVTVPAGSIRFVFSTRCDMPYCTINVVSTVMLHLPAIETKGGGESEKVGKVIKV